MTIQPTVSHHEDSLVLFSWLDVTPSDTPMPVVWAGYADRAVQVVGSGTVAIDGSIDGQTWVPIRDIFDAPIVSSGIYQIAALTMHFKPRTTTGAASFYLLARATR